MHIAKLTLSSFRCFGPTPTVIQLGPMAAFVGTNGSGKTAILKALGKLFGTLQSDRTLEASDFHLAKGKTRDSLKPGEKLDLSIEAKIAFPELNTEDGNKGAIAECFNQMMVTTPGEDPFCLVKLEGTWTKNNLPEGELDQNLYWIHPIASGTEQKKTPMASHERSIVHVHYIPAARDPSKQIKNVSGTIINRLFRAVRWSDTMDADIEKASDDIHGTFGKEHGVQSIERTIDRTWKKLYPSGVHDGVKLRPIARRLEDILRQMQAVFTPGTDGEEQDLDQLSDGLKSLFYLAMVCAGFQIETQVAQGDAEISQHEVDPIV
jgi:putative ATP-dependent endonuclease of the OLD family